MIQRISEKFTDRQRSFLFVVTLFLLMRFGLWAWMVLVRGFLPVELAPDDLTRPYMGIQPVSNVWLDVWQRWDVLQYQSIAERGYGAFETSLFTPPLYPLLMKFAAILFDGSTLLGGLMVSSLFCFAALWMFYLLLELELPDTAAAKRGFVYLLLFPTAFFLFAPYTESLFFLGAVGCLYALRKKRWITAGLWGILAASARLTGAIMLLPVLWAAWDTWRVERNWQVWLAPSLTGLGGIAFPLYVWLGMGLSPLAPFVAQSARFHGGFTFPGWAILSTIRQLWQGIYPVSNSFDLLFTIMFILGTILVLRHLPRIYGIYSLVFMALYLMRYADIYPLLSMSRYVLAIFPVFMALPLVDDNPWIKRLIVYASIMGLLFLSAQFAIWGWVG